MPLASLALGMWLGCGGDPAAPGRLAGTEPEPEPTATTADTGTVDDGVCEVATWEIAADPVLRTWCTPCHASSLSGEERQGAPEGMDFDRWELAAPFALAIKDAAVPDDARMPPEGMASAEERAWLAAWVDCGAPGQPQELGPCEVLSPAPEGASDPCGGGYNQVLGDFAPGEGTDLSCLCDVEGTLTVADPVVELPLLSHVGGDVVPSHGALQRLSAPRLEAVGGSLQVVDQEAVEAIELPVLRDVGGDVVVSGSGAFTRLELQQLTTVGGDLRVEGLPTVEQVWLPRVEEVGGSYVVSDNPALQELPFFFELVSVGGSLVVRDNPQLTEVLLANHLESLGGGFEVGGNQLSTLVFPYELEEVPGDVYVHDEPYLQHIDGLHATQVVGGRVWLEALPSLLGVGLLPSAERLGGVWLDELPELLSPVESVVTQIDGDVRVTNSDLSTVPWADDLVTIGGDLELRNLDGVRGVGGFGVLEEIDGTTTVQETTIVVAELPELQRSGTMIFEGNPLLQAVLVRRLQQSMGSQVYRNLPAFTLFGYTDRLYINGDLVVDDLDALQSLEQLHAVDVLSGALVIRNNAGIDLDDITALLEAIEQHLGPVRVQGNG